MRHRQGSGKLGLVAKGGKVRCSERERVKHGAVGRCGRGLGPMGTTFSLTSSRKLNGFHDAAVLHGEVHHQRTSCFRRPDKPVPISPVRCPSVFEKFRSQSMQARSNSNIGRAKPSVPALSFPVSSLSLRSRPSSRISSRL